MPRRAMRRQLCGAPCRHSSRGSGSGGSGEPAARQPAVPLHTAAAAATPPDAAAPPVGSSIGDEQPAAAASSASALPQLDGPMRRRVGTMMAAQFLLSCGYGCIAPVLPGLAVELGIGAAGAGALLSAPAMMRLFLNLPAGRMADNPRVGRQPLMVGGCVVMSLACAGSYAATGAESVGLLLAVTRLAFGAGSALAVAGTSAYIADISHTIPDYRARLMGVQTTMVNLGWVVGPPTAGVMATAYGPSVRSRGSPHRNVITGMMLKERLLVVAGQLPAGLRVGGDVHGAAGHRAADAAGQAQR